MDWFAQRGGEVLLHVVTPDAFLAWLAARTTSPVVAQLDPYRDTTLDGAAQTSLLAALHEVRNAGAAAARAEHERHSHLPRDPATREPILARLVARSLDRDEHQRTLAELSALLELARDEGATVHAVGD